MRPTLRHGVQVGIWRYDHRRTDSHARRTGYAADPGGASTCEGAALHRARDLRVGDNTGKLGRQGDQERLFAFVKASALGLLHDEYAEHIALVNDGYTEEGVKGLFAQALKQLEARVVLGAFQVDRLFALGDESDEAIARTKACNPHLVLVEALGCAQHIAAAAGISEVHAAHLRAHRVAHAAHDDLQRIAQAFGGVYLLNDMAQRFQHLLPFGIRGAAKHRREFLHGASIDFPLEGNHLVERVPVTDPLPVVELGYIVEVEAHGAVFIQQPQEKPFLLLADTHRLLVLAYVALRQAIAQPAARGAQYFDGSGFKADFFAQLPVERLARRFAPLDTALWELPGIAAAHASRPEQLATIIGQHYPHVRTKAVRVDQNYTPVISTGYCSTLSRY